MTRSTNSKKPNLEEIVALVEAMVEQQRTTSCDEARTFISKLSTDTTPFDTTSFDSLCTLLHRAAAPAKKRIYLDTYLNIAFATLRDAPALLSAYVIVLGMTLGLEATIVAKPDAFSGSRYGSLHVLFEIRAVLNGWLHQSDADGSLEADLMREAVSRPATREFLSVNRHNDVLWFDRDRFGDLVSWFAIIASIELQTEDVYETRAEMVVHWIDRWIAARDASGYQVDRLIRFLETEAP